MVEINLSSIILLYCRIKAYLFVGIMPTEEDQEMRLFWIKYFVSSALLRRASFLKSLDRYVLIVFTLNFRLSAISLG